MFEKPPQKETPSRRLWLANEAGLKLVVKDINVAGKEKIREIPTGAKVVIMTTHLTDLDVPIAIHAVANDLNVVVMNESVHHKFWGQQGEIPTNIGLHIAGKNNFLPIDYERDDSGKKSPQSFNPDNFEPAAKTMEEGKAVLIAAHNPSQTPIQNLDSIKGGYGGVYLAELTDAYILPVTVVLDRATGMYEDSVTKKITSKPNASVVIGQPFKLEKINNIERFSELMKKREQGERLTSEETLEFSQLANSLREKSQEVITKMSEQLTTSS